MNNKNIWIINENLSSPDISESGHSRHYCLSKEFEKEFYNVTLITSSFSHNPNRKIEFRGLYKLFGSGIDTLILKGVSYKNSTSKLRILNWIIFSLLLFIIPIVKLKRPSIIIMSSTAMIPIFNVIFFKAIFPNSKFIFETRDLWPLTPIELAGYSESSLYIRVLRYLERLSYTNADYVVSVLKNSHIYVKKLLNVDQFNIEWISNGIDVDSLEEFGSSSDVLFDQWENLELLKENGAKIVGYAGNLGKANSMDYIIMTFNEYFKNTKFYLAIVGDGDQKEGLENLAASNPNILFYKPVDKKELFKFYKLCDYLYLSWRNKELYKYGISANKIFEYMYFKKPIIMSSNIPNNIIEDSNSGINVEAESIEDLKDKLLYLNSLDRFELDKFGQNGFAYVTKYFNYSYLAGKYIKIFNKIL